MDEVKQLVTDIKNKNLKPIYFLMGEEPYYIDKISDFIEDSVLLEEEKGFNQMVLYGRDVSIEDIVGNAKRYPMMAERQVVIVKEAQDLSRTIEKLVDYTNNPQPTTVLVVNYKYKKIDKRKALYKALKKIGVVYESKKLYENQVADWIRRVLAPKDYTISPKAAQMLVEFLGTNLSKINNELEKLMVVLPVGSTISAKDIEANIGISKDYNVFELQKALGRRNFGQSFKIISYMGKNAKKNPIQPIIIVLFNYFSKLLLLKYSGHKSETELSKLLELRPYFLSEYKMAASRYDASQVIKAISALKTADLSSKGVGTTSNDPNEILQNMLVGIFV